MSLLWSAGKKESKVKTVLLKEIKGLQTKTINALNKKGIYTVDDIVRIFPRKYLDYREIVGLEDAIEKDCAIEGYVESTCKDKVNNISMLCLELIESSSGEIIHVKWFGQVFLWDSVHRMNNKEIVLCGKVKNHPKYGYCITNPYLFCEKQVFHGKIVPVYPKMKGVSEDMFQKILKQSLNMTVDPLEEIVQNKLKSLEVMSYEEALRHIHTPKALDDIEKALKRIVLNDMMYFSLRLAEENNEMPVESPFSIKETATTDSFINSLEFKLTADQRMVYEHLVNKMKNRKRVNTLIQGDVSCGKTMVAFLGMFLMAENGYQSVIMAPTQVLAMQHYEKLCEYAVPYGFKTALLTGDVKGKQEKEILDGIKAGEYHFIVGTHKTFTETVLYNNLGLVITDEEHRFGVGQRENLNKKALDGAHTITMSATPIPRSVAEIVYGKNKEIFEIRSMPNGRVPIQTAINNSERVIYDFVKKQLDSGRQCYVICPLIEATGDETEDKIESIEATVRKYKDHFEGMGYHVGMATGGNNKATKDASLKAMDEFKENKYQILVATTVIEVGVNVPNASLIIINNAERFGLAQLHQLRGRVGRGNHKSYCILKSADKENRRLNVLVSTTDGFKIAEEDMKLRGIGDIFGSEQTGYNKYTELIMAMPELYKEVTRIVTWMQENQYGSKLLALYREREIVVEN